MVDFECYLVVWDIMLLIFNVIICLLLNEVREWLKSKGWEYCVENMVVRKYVIYFFYLV